MSSKSFRAVTWNVAGGTPRPPSADKLGAIAEQLVQDSGVSLLFLQEFSQPGVVAAFKEAGLKVHKVRPQYAVAWVPDLWVPTLREDVALAETVFYRKPGTKGVLTEGARVILADRCGRSLDAVSYHLPSSVQQKNPAAARIQVTREAMEAMRALSRTTCADACIFAGDDNVDERGAFGPWGFMLKGATGLRQVQAPSATLGKTRRVDDFRVKGLEVGQGWVKDGLGDHRIHGRTFRWKK